MALNNAAAAAAAAAPAPAAGGAPPPPPPVLTPQDVMHGLIGTGNFFTIAQQLAAGAAYWEVATHCAQTAFQKVPDTKGDSTSRWGTVRQGPNEPYAVFIDRLYDSLKRQIADTQVQEVIMKQLAFDNANEDCRVALRPLISQQGINIADMLKACQSIGSESHKARLLAAALSQAANPMKDKLCFGCNKPGHFRAQCRSTGSQSGKRPPSKCPICKKGFHWANQCHSNPANQNQTSSQGQSSQNQGNRQTGPPRAPVNQ
ncbi:endogenous retrovirus group K member 24 Gag polyproteinpolyprotein-like isoform X1 [Podarcis lilfordi]|uniref:Endogenous retrovirus group K member 24 Gag polyproteinpolyprotein-like isoform X1 n=1 Tax=Podarcis lilfordi TaxID=74358 RepID=A0AA35LN69_9SAUR|nr:endogenous retrovirus group K member 24 Gag polyproteinpolyprotein-like isoform X1 [Podarcis lilfordi]